MHFRLIAKENGVTLILVLRALLLINNKIATLDKKTDCSTKL